MVDYFRSHDRAGDVGGRSLEDHPFVAAAGKETTVDATTTILAEVVLLPEHCYRCGHATSPVIGLWVAPAVVGDEYQVFDDDCGWFLEYDDSTAEIIAGVCSDTILDAHGAGPLRWCTTTRRSRRLPR